MNRKYKDSEFSEETIKTFQESLSKASPEELDKYREYIREICGENRETSLAMGIIKEYEAEDGFIYRLNARDELEVIGGIGVSSPSSPVWAIKKFVCVAECVENEALKLDDVGENEGLVNSNDYIEELEAPFCLHFGVDCFANRSTLKKIVAVLDDDELVDLIEGMVKSRVEQKCCTIEEAAEIYKIGVNRLRTWVKEHPDHECILRVNSRVIIKMRLFEKYLDAVGVF